MSDSEKWKKYGKGFCISCDHCMEATGKDTMSDLCKGCSFIDEKINWKQRHSLTHDALDRCASASWVRRIKNTCHKLFYQNLLTT